MQKIWRILWWGAAGLFILSAILICRPAQTQKVVIPLQFQDASGVEISRDVELDMPAFLWMGESKSVRLAFLVEDQPSSGAKPVTIETQLEMPVSITDDAVRWEALVPGQQATFSWSVRGETPGLIQGKLWVWVEAGVDRQALLARPVELEVRSIGGFQPGVVRWTCAVCALACLAAGFVRRTT